MHSLFGPVPLLTLLAPLALPASAQSTGEWRYVAPPGGDAQAVAASPTQPGLVLAAIGDAQMGSTSLGAVFRSTDGGASWSQALGWPQQSVTRMFDVAFGSNGTAFPKG